MQQKRDVLVLLLKDLLVQILLQGNTWVMQ